MIEQDLRDKLIATPEMILEDRDLMKALIAANERAMGANVIDLRGIAMERLEGRLDRLEDTHRSVIAAAYENLAGTNLIHRAILQMLDPLGFEEFLLNLSTEVAQTLRVDCIRLVLETAQRDADPALGRLGEVLHVAEPGFVADYVAGGRNVPLRPVTLRRTLPDTMLYGEASPGMASEALMRLDFGRGRLPGMLAMGSADADHFKPTQGTDLLAFFAGVFERTMRRWLS
ncbi:MULTISPECIES: DUF484 family protein [Cereibacter]|uniref:DUF484 family protein n=1 Tax=Cereibacter TaxID=1653176 RepID=UPI000C6DA856|nr:MULTISPECIES: DUF484 family protein [Cereibacter]